MRILSLAAALSLALAFEAHAADGFYTLEQADNGHQLFNNICAECHRPDLTGAMGPALKGDAFLQRFGHKPIGDLYRFEHANMPATNPGSLPADELWPITAYILQQNGLPAGDHPLGPDDASKVFAK